MDKPSKKAELQQRILADGLSEMGLLSLYNLGQLRRVSAGRHLFKEGDQNDVLFLVVDGQCRSEPAADNNCNENNVFREGDWIGELLFFQTPLRVVSVTAVTPTVVLVVNGRTFRALPSETQSFILKKLNDQTTRRLCTLTREYAQGNKVNAYLTRYIRDQHEGRIKDYEHSEVLQNILKSIPRLPIYVMKLVQLLLNEKASSRDIATLAKEDPSLVSQILRTVNSSHYALSSKIADLNHAILYLGFNEVYQIVVAGGMQKTMPNTREFQDLHQHSVTISHLAFEICQLHNKQKSSTMSTIAVLHDIGKSIILLLKKQNPKWNLFVEMLDPAKIGAMLLTQWNIPKIVTEAIEFQHCPSFVPASKLPTQHADYVAMLLLAHLSSSILEGDLLSPADHPFLRDYMKILKLDDVTFTEFFTNRILPALKNKTHTLPMYLRSLIQDYPKDQSGRTA